MKKIITTILSLSLLAGNAAIPVFAENESAEGVTERVEVMAEDTVIEPTPEIEVPAENTVIEPTPEIEVPAEEVLQAEQSQKTDEPVFDVPLFDEPVFPEAEKKPKEDFELFSSDFSLMASNGSCGENVTYTIDDAGTLTISGTGAMRDYSYYSDNPSPFNNNTNIKTVIIESGVTSIGSYAFSYCSGLTSITIPDSVTSIGSYAFSGCSGLTNVTIGDSVTSISSDAFSDCSGLTTVNYNATKCTSMGSDNYPVFKGCNALTTVNIGKNVTNIPSYAFSGCSGLTSITIGGSVTSIGSYAFYNCSGLTEITIPDSVTSIGSDAFRYCSGLTSITIPDSVTSIGGWAFSYCSGLKTVNYNAINCSSPSYSSDGAFYNLTSIETVNIGEKVTNIPSYAFRGCSGITSITIPDSVTSIGSGAFYGCSGLTSITIGGSVTSIGSDAFYGCKGLTSITIPDSVTSIGYEAFYNCSGLTSITIPDSVTSIGNYAFNNCSGLTTVNYNATNCTYMGSDNYPVFNGCNALTTVNIGNNVTNIPSYAFYSCTKLTDIYYQGTYVSFASCGYENSQTANLHCSDKECEKGKWGSCGAKAIYTLDDAGTLTISGMGDMKGYYHRDSPFCGKTNIKTVVIENGVTSIGYEAFYGCSGLTSITIPESVTSIGYHAFSGCSGLTSITIPDSVTSIGSDAFYDCSNLDSVYISDLEAYLNIDMYSTPMSYAKKLYLNGKRLTGSIEIPNTVTKIPPCAFRDCDGIKSITIPDSVTSIGVSAFYGCSGLTKVNVLNPSKWCYITFGNSDANPLKYAKNMYSNDTLVTYINVPNDVTSINDNAFYNCESLKSITIPDSVTSIGNSAFYGCSGLTSITIPESVTSIGNSAFDDCSGLKTVNYNAINCSSPSYSSDGAFYYLTSIETVNIGDNVTNIPSYAFKGCSGIESVNLPQSVTDIGASAFSDCSGLGSIIIPEKVTAINKNTFYGCSNLMKVYIPKATAEIEKSAFQNCTSLKTVEFGGSQADWEDMYIGSDNESLTNAKVNYNSKPENAVLSDLDYLTYTKNDDNTITITNCYQAASNIVIPATIEGLPVKTINASAFANNTKLISVTIPDSVTSIGERAFYECSNLKNISIPNGITTIASNTFYNCSSLEAVSLPEGVTTINGYAFYGCDKLSNVYYSGNKNKWNKINFNYGNDNLKNANVTYGKAPTYTITTGTKFGTITPDKTSAAMGEKVTFTVTPTSGYMLTDGSVKVNNGEVSMTSNGRSYSFTMPDKNVTITAAFEKIPPEMVTVTFNAGDGTLKGSSTMKVEKGKALTQSGIPTAEKDGYKFSGWLLNGKTFSLNTPITENITLTALWVENGIQKSTVPTLSKYADIMNFEKSAGANGDAIFTVTKKGNAKVPQPVVFVAHFGTDGTLQSADKFDFTKNGDTYTAIVDKQTGNYKLFVWTDDAASMLEPITAPLTAADGVFE